MREIPLTQGVVAFVDDEDFERVNQYTWTAVWSEQVKTFYAMRTMRVDTNRRRGIKMHRYILGVTDRLVHIDHWNHIGVDNRRSNLRTCTAAQNFHNRRKIDGINGIACTSRYKGVCWVNRDSKWYAAITIPSESGHGRGLVKRLGSFNDEVQAALAYNQAAREYFGEFALLNTIQTEVHSCQ